MQTDLALEVQESFLGNGGEIQGVVLEKEEVYSGNVVITRVKILNEIGAKQMGKPVGTYVTIETSWLGEEIYQNQCRNVVGTYLERMLPENWSSMLVVGLGNGKLTADALGPEIVGKILMTRMLSGASRQVSGIVPGVMAQTGMEAVEIVQGIVEQTKPDVIIVFDALAACSARRLCRTIQLTDTGIQPGSGVGNHRKGFSRKALGVPVIAVGVPTVIRGASLVHDLLGVTVDFLRREEATKGLADSLDQLCEREKHELMRELLEQSAGNLFVTPKDMDEQLGRMSTVLADAINSLVLGA
ncbi:MAG: GPR endopeptidase [Lachnospiraceae bacterium]